MKIYLVGGAVRDALLNLPIKDKDWIVTGATPQQMIKQGYKPVGQDFPVFLHPKTNEEYALARTERKSGKGYKGFTFFASPDITLEEDLIRRDLTINAMAQADDGEIIDPFGGQQDIEQRLLRHVSDAFSEDPLRVLRVARFAARFAHLGFQVAPETLALMQQLSASDELQHLTPERVWQEFSKALDSQHPELFLQILNQVGAWQTLFAPLPAPQAHQFDGLLTHPCFAALTTEQRFALLMHALLSAQSSTDAIVLIKQSCQKLRVPNKHRQCAEKLLTLAGALCNLPAQSADTQLDLLQLLGLFKQPQQAQAWCNLMAVIAHWDQAQQHQLQTQLEQLLAQAALIRPDQLMQEGFKGKALGEEIKRRQIAALQTLEWQRA